jgi:2-aminoadipate transaminase
MPQETSTQTIAVGDRTSDWTASTILEFLTDAAKSIGVGTATDAGWAPPAPAGTTPVMMTGGIPDPDTLPRHELLDAMKTVLHTSPAEALRYGGTQGYEALRVSLAERYAAIDGIPQGPENFVLTNGSAGGIDLISSTFINPGDIVVAEAPTFSGTLRTFRGHMAKLLPVPTDNEGMDTDALEEILSRQQRDGRPIKAIYTIPDYHNPMGTYMSLRRRQRLVELSARYQALVIEDDAYSEISFGAEQLPSVYSLAGGHGVLRAGTFSKTIATGLRVGWVQGRADFVDACVRMRFDMGASPLLHRMLGEFVGSGQWDSHIKKMRKLYADKCAALSGSLINECEPYMRFQRPQGGFFLWVECRDGINAGDVAKYAAEEGALIVPGRNFYMDGQDTSHLRLAFSTEKPDDLKEAGKRLARAFARAAG